jgi:PilZ domain
LTQSSTPAEIAIEHRRSTRAVLALPIVVKGVDALHEPFRENTNTVMVSCHGCKYQSKHYVPRGSVVELEIPRSRQGAPRQVSGKVIWVQRPRNTREVFHIAVDFEVPGNVWGIQSPPGDWFPVPGGPEPSTPENDERPARPIEAIKKEDATASWDESEIASVSRTANEIKANEEANTTDVEIALSDTRINAEVRSVIENAVKAAVARLAKSIADEAREERIAAAAQLDAKVQQAVEAAVANLSSPQRKKSKKRN